MTNAIATATTYADLIWFRVETPSVFREYRLPADATNWSRADERKFRELERLADKHGTIIQQSSYRVG